MKLQKKQHSDDYPAVKINSQSKLIDQFIEQGFCVQPNAVANDKIQFFLNQLYAELASKRPRLFATFWSRPDKKEFLPAKPEYLSKAEAKILDVHYHLPSSHDLIFSPSILQFLWDLFGEAPVAFQSLYFEHGSAQGAHNDTAFVYVEPASLFAASWIALEDIKPNTGELFYYPGSHKYEEVFANGGKRFDPTDESAKDYSQELEAMLEEAGMKKEVFLPDKAETLFWASDLVHGGSPHTNNLSRRSLVTHYHPISAITPYAKEKNIRPKETESGGCIISAT
jgi:ectoine hydroxylase-related dioxygenase (phytanoyl-CoA dioxygenase family)